MSKCDGISASTHAQQVYGGFDQQRDSITGGIAMHPSGGTYVGGRKRKGSKKSGSKKGKGKSKGKKSRGRRSTGCNWMRFGGQKGGDCGCSGGDSNLLPKIN